MTKLTLGKMLLKNFLKVYNKEDELGYINYRMAIIMYPNLILNIILGFWGNDIFGKYMSCHIQVICILVIVLTFIIYNRRLNQYWQKCDIIHKLEGGT